MRTVDVVCIQNVSGDHKILNSKHYFCLTLAILRWLFTVAKSSSPEPTFHNAVQELIRRWDSERELFLQYRTCRGQRLRPL